MRMRLHAAAMATCTTISSLQLDVHTLKAFQKDYRTDPVLKHVWNASRASTEYEVTRGLIYMKSNDKTRRVCVPSSNKLRLDVIHNAHDAAIMADPGIRRMQLAAAQWYFWQNMYKDIKDYVRSCESCMRYKSCTGRKNGKLQPIPIP